MDITVPVLISASVGVWVAVGVIFLSTVLNASYFLPIVWRAFWKPLPPADAAHPHHGEGPVPVVLALTVTAFGTLALFFFPDIPFGLAEAMIADQPAPVGAEAATTAMEVTQ